MCDHIYCVRLSAVKPATGERQTVIVNQVPAEHEEQARDTAISRFLSAHPECSDSLRFVSARRTDDAFWSSRN